MVQNDTHVHIAEQRFSVHDVPKMNRKRPNHLHLAMRMRCHVCGQIYGMRPHGFALELAVTL